MVVLTDVVAKICAGLDIGALVDLGSGKGYLSQVGCEAIKCAVLLFAYQDLIYHQFIWSYPV